MKRMVSEENRKPLLHDPIHSLAVVEEFLRVCPEQRLFIIRIQMLPSWSRHGGLLRIVGEHTQVLERCRGDDPLSRPDEYSQ